MPGGHGGDGGVDVGFQLPSNVRWVVVVVVGVVGGCGLGGADLDGDGGGVGVWRPHIQTSSLSSASQLVFLLLRQ